MLKRILIPVLIVVFWGCEKELFLSPDFEEQLVIQSFIAPQNELIEVTVAKSVPSLGSVRLKNIPIETATVTLSNSNGNTATLLLQDANENDEGNAWRRYVIESENFPIEAGGSYFLKVTTPQGLTAQASCMIPTKRVNSNDVFVKFSDFIEDSQELERFHIEWEDFLNETNYYSWSAISFIQLNTPDDEGNEFIQSGLVTEYLSDNGLSEGDLIVSNSRNILGTNAIYNPNNSYLQIYLAHTDQNYYDYHLDLIRQQQFEDNEPNITPPISLSGNIEDGIGVFAGYNLLVLKVPLKE